MIKPTFKPKRFKDGSGWYVEVERPDGSTAFGGHIDNLDFHFSDLLVIHSKTSECDPN